MYDSIFTQLSIVVAIVAIVSLIMRALRQPLIMGYIISGVLVGPSVLSVVTSHEVFETFSAFGITLLLFIIGLGLNASVIKGLGRVSLTTSLSILPFLGAIVFGITQIFGFSLVKSMILVVALFFSSTIIILKVLSDKKEVSRMYGQICIGILLIEDIIATIALITLAAIAGGDFGADALLLLVGKIGLLGVGLFIVGNYIVPRFSKLFARSQELLFIFALSWGLVVATLFELAGLSHEVGALFGGIALAGLPYATEMASKLKPLRDFFIVLFFVNLGEALALSSVKDNFLIAHVLALAIVLFKPLAVMISLGSQGYTKLTSYKTAIHLSQISEFSIVFIAIAVKDGFVDEPTLSLIALVAFISIGISTYLMQYDEKIYHHIEKYLRIFERKNIKEQNKKGELYPVILFGYHKGGHEFLRTFRKIKQKYLVVDYDPDVIDHLESQGIRHAYGDATDDEFLGEINTSQSKLIVSTITNIEVNRELLTYLHRHGSKANFICHANNLDEASELYERGASYVSLPHYIGSEKVSAFIKKHGFNKTALRQYRKKHIIAIGRQALK